MDQNNYINLNIDKCKYLIFNSFNDTNNYNLKIFDENIINSEVDYFGLT